MPILKEDELDIISHSADQTRRLGMRLGALLVPGDIICLSGDMGAGKTMFAAGIGVGWGAGEPLTSPTFSLVHEHTRPHDGMRLYHLDCYRLSEHDADSIGLDDILNGRGAALLEWAENVGRLLPPHRLWIELRVLELMRRNLIFDATGDRYKTLVSQFRQAAFGV